MSWIFHLGFLSDKNKSLLSQPTSDWETQPSTRKPPCSTGWRTTPGQDDFKTLQEWFFTFPLFDFPSRFSLVLALVPRGGLCDRPLLRRVRLSQCVPRKLDQLTYNYCIKFLRGWKRSLVRSEEFECNRVRSQQQIGRRMHLQIELQSDWPVLIKGEIAFCSFSLNLLKLIAPHSLSIRVQWCHH